MLHIRSSDTSSLTTTHTPYSYRMRACIEITRFVLSLPFPTGNWIMKQQSLLLRTLYQSQVSPVLVTSSPALASLLGASTWYGSADLSDGLSVLIYLHGGGFCIGNSMQWPLFFQGVIDRALEKGISMRILSIEYPLACEGGANGVHNSVTIVQSAFEYLTTEIGIPPRQIMLGGDSAGGNIALETCLTMKEKWKKTYGDADVGVFERKHAGGADLEEMQQHEQQLHASSSPHTSHTHHHHSHTHSHSHHSLASTLPSSLLLISPWTNLSSTSAIFRTPRHPETIENERYDLLSYDVLCRFKAMYVQNNQEYVRRKREADEEVEWWEMERRGRDDGVGSVDTSREVTPAGSSTDLDAAAAASSSDVSPSSTTSSSDSSSSSSTEVDSSLLIDPTHPLLSPLYADLSSLPPILLLFGSREILSVDLREFRDVCQQQYALNITTIEQKEMIHDYPVSPEAFSSYSREGIEQIVDYMIQTWEQQRRRMSVTTKQAVMKRNLFSNAHFQTQPE